MHLIIDGYGTNRDVLQDEELIYRVLDLYPEKIGMKKVTAPYVFCYEGSNPQDWGISGFVLIGESHISIHTFVERLYVNIDVFSCRDFDAKGIVQDIKETFKLKKMKFRLLKRGLNYI